MWIIEIAAGVWLAMQLCKLWAWWAINAPAPRPRVAKRPSQHWLARWVRWMNQV